MRQSFGGPPGLLPGFGLRSNPLSTRPTNLIVGGTQMRKVYSLLFLLAAIAAGLPALPALAHNSKEVFAISGSTTSAGVIYLRVADAGGSALKTVNSAFFNGDGATTVRNALVTALFPATLGISAVGTAGDKIEFTYAPGTALRFLLSADNVSYTELTYYTPVVVRGVTFTGTGLPLTNGNGQVSAPAFDLWGLLAVALTLAAGGWLMLRSRNLGQRNLG